MELPILSAPFNKHDNHVNLFHTSTCLATGYLCQGWVKIKHTGNFLWIMETMISKEDSPQKNPQDTRTTI